MKKVNSRVETPSATFDSNTISSSNDYNDHKKNGRPADTETAGTVSNNQKESTRMSFKRPTSFAMSGCGWLCPFYLGVIEELKQQGYMNSHSVYAGTSSGALGAFIACCDIPTDYALQAIIEMSKKKSFKKNIDAGIQNALRPLLPSDALKVLYVNIHIFIALH